jgi:BirA family biotin operon repressor/biotin-[acetyl-CoA-carboxylase] ligase
MDIARELAADPTAHGAVVLADEQTAGRGRRGRPFYSPPGDNLYFTVVLRVAPVQASVLTLAVPLAAVEGVRIYCPSAAIKWPNDVWIGERKCCGMLIDAESNGAEITALVGIGINVNGDPGQNPELAGIATSLALARGDVIPREILIAAVLNNLESNLAEAPESLVDRYRQASNTVGRMVRVAPTAGPAFEGFAEDIDARGALVVRRTDGAIVAVEAADVSLRHA